MPDYSEWRDGTWKKLHPKENHWYDYLHYWRYLINAILIGAPVSIVSLLGLAANWWTSITWNKMWANVNVFMILKTVYVTMQTLNVMPVVFEIDSYMRHFKAFRALSFLSAVGFLIQYLGTIGGWAYIGNDPPDWL